MKTIRTRDNGDLEIHELRLGEVVTITREQLALHGYVQPRTIDPAILLGCMAASIATSVIDDRVMDQTAGHRWRALAAEVSVDIARRILAEIEKPTGGEP